MFFHLANKVQKSSVAIQPSSAKKYLHCFSVQASLHLMRVALSLILSKFKTGASGTDGESPPF